MRAFADHQQRDEGGQSAGQQPHALRPLRHGHSQDADPLGVAQQRHPQALRPITCRRRRRGLGRGGIQHVPGLDDLHVAEGTSCHGGVDPDRFERLAEHITLPGQRDQHLLLQVGYVDHGLGEARRPSVLGDQAWQILQRGELAGAQRAAQQLLAITGHRDAFPGGPSSCTSFSSHLYELLPNVLTRANVCQVRPGAGRWCAACACRPQVDGAGRGGGPDRHPQPGHDVEGDGQQQVGGLTPIPHAGQGPAPSAKNGAITIAAVSVTGGDAGPRGCRRPREGRSAVMAGSSRRARGWVVCRSCDDRESVAQAGDVQQPGHARRNAGQGERDAQ